MKKEWKYITPEVIASGRIVPGNAAAAAEAEEYNRLAAEGHAKLGKWKMYSEMYMTASIIALVTGIISMIAGLSSTIEPAAGMAAVLVSALGAVFIGLRYFYNSYFTFRWKEPVVKGAAVLGKQLKISLAGEAIALAVVLGCFLIPVTLHINTVLSVAAAVVFLLAVIIYAPDGDKHKLAVSAALAVLPLLISIFTLPYAVLMAVFAVSEEKRRRELTEAELYPDFRTVEVTDGGFMKAGLINGIKERSGQNNEMESL